MKRILLLCLGLALMGCGEDSGPGRDVASVVVSPGDKAIPVAATQQYTATALDDNGDVIPDRVFIWQSSQPAVANVTSAGLATGLIGGTTSISASTDGVSGSSTLIVVGTPAGQHLTAAGGLLQRGPVSRQLPVPFVVEARDGSAPLAGVEVFWTIKSGGGSVSSGTTVTGADGRTAVFSTLGAIEGIQEFVARAPALTAADTNQRNVAFSAVAISGTGSVFLTQVPVPANYGLHDTFIRDGIAFLNVWDSGIMIYDVGNGMRGGSPSHPVLISSIMTQGGQAHNSWWFHNPVTHEKRYLFVGEEGPAVVGGGASGDIHVVDVSDLTHPVEVATYSMAGAGTHNFWVDEANQILYAAYYNGGVVSIDISGTLTGSINAREIDRILPGTNSYVWGVMLFNGSVYASDMVNGFWQLSTTAGDLAVAGGGNNVLERFTSDLWLHGNYGYTGTWGSRAAIGNAVKVWQLGSGGSPTLVDSVIVPNIGTVSDVEVSQDGSLLMFGAEGGGNSGFHLYSLADPASPVFLASHFVNTGIHTASFAYVGGRVFAFGAKNASNPALMILDVTDLVP